jgi:hypothetical protein
MHLQVVDREGEFAADGSAVGTCLCGDRKEPFRNLDLSGCGMRLTPGSRPVPGALPAAAGPGGPNKLKEYHTGRYPVHSRQSTLHLPHSLL